MRDHHCDCKHYKDMVKLSIKKNDVQRNCTEMIPNSTFDLDIGFYPLLPQKLRH